MIDSYIHYLCIIELNQLEIGLRKDDDNYYLDFLKETDNDSYAIQKFSKKVSDVKPPTNDKETMVLLTNMLTEFLLTVK